MEDQEKNKNIDVYPMGNIVNDWYKTLSIFPSLAALSKNHLIFENLMHGRSTRTPRSKSDTHEES